MFDTTHILSSIPEYREFMTLEELDVRAKEVSEKFGFQIKEIGTSEEGRPIYLIKAGNGSKKVFVWGFPHPNEPIGSLTVDFLLTYLGEHKSLLETADITWYFIYTADPDGTTLNEKWFKGELTVEKYFLHFFRPPGKRMIDWTFPVRYEDFAWVEPMPETKALMKIIEKIQPDIMYPLHNAGFGGAYFLTTKDLGKAFRDKIIAINNELGIPLDFGEPEEPFMKEIEKPFYYEFTSKDYYDHVKKIKGNVNNLVGNNAAGYLLEKNPESLTIVSETPYFFDEAILDQSESEQVRKDIWKEFYDTLKNHKDSVRDIVPKILEKLDTKDHFYYVMELYNNNLKHDFEKMRAHVAEAAEYQRKATKAEVFNSKTSALFYSGGLYFGQVRRAALKAGMKEEALFLEGKIKECAQKLDKISDWKLIPIQNMVRFQVAFLLEALNHSG